MNLRSILWTVICGTVAAIGPGSASSASPPTIAVTMPVGGVVNVPASGVTLAEVAPAGVAGAWADGDHVTVWGMQQGTATLLLTSPDGIEARPVQVTAPGSAQGLFDQGSCAVPLGAAATSASVANATATEAYGTPNHTVTWSPGEWRAFWDFAGSGTASLTAADSLSTPLAMVGVPNRPGVAMSWDRWKLTANQSVGALAYQMPLGSGMMMEVGDTTLGPIGEATVAAGDVSASSVALLSPTGQVVTGAQTSLALGPFGVGYALGPAGGAPSVQYHAGPLTLSAANWPGEGPSVGLNFWFRNGTTVQGSWGQQTGWNAQVQMPLGPGTAPRPSNNAAALTGVVLPDWSVCGSGGAPVLTSRPQ